MNTTYESNGINQIMSLFIDRVTRANAGQLLRMTIQNVVGVNTVP